MTDFAALLQPDRGQPARTIHLVDKKTAEQWIKAQSEARRALIEAARFDGKTGYQFLILPGVGSAELEVVSAVANVERLSPWCLAKLAEALPAGAYRLAEGREPGPALLGWLVGQHRFERYKQKPQNSAGERVLLTSDPAQIEPAVRLARATALVRDLIDTPASDLGPAELEQAIRSAAEASGAKVQSTSGDALERDYPMIAAVGRAAVRERAPRLIELEWGDERHPRIAIVGKGVCFDSGGLDIKPSAGMRLMKKDMGGAAHAVGLALLIMEARLPVRLHLLIPTVENAVGGGAFRPGDVLPSRSGLHVEIDNTDAEGRLILADALTRACEEEPELLLDFATLTGAARVALGPDLPALFSNDDDLASEIEEAAKAVSDPLWRMPLWDGYDDMLKSDLADLSNSADSPFGGSITAALFLKRFVQDGVRWAHLDTFAWQPKVQPGRPRGGEAMGMRAAFEMLRRRYSAGNF